MPDAPHPPRPAGNPLTRKLGPLPMWAWLVLVVAAFYLYRRSHPSSGGTAGAGTSSTDAANPVPGFDAASMSGGGGIGATATPQVVNNYYYGTTAAAQAAGGGTSPGATATGTTGTRSGTNAAGTVGTPASLPPTIQPTNR